MLVEGMRLRGEMSAGLASAPSARPSEGFLRPLKPRRPEPAQGSAQGPAFAQALGFAPVSAQQKIQCELYSALSLAMLLC